MPPANGEEKQLINKKEEKEEKQLINKKENKNPDEASLASQLSASSSATEKREEYENFPSDPPVPDQEERGPIKDRSCTDVLCLGRIFKCATILSFQVVSE